MSIFLLTSSFFANAGLIQVQDDIVDDQYISGSSSGFFNLNDLLASDANFNNPYDINSATIRFIFADDSSDSVFYHSSSSSSSNPSYYSSCGGGNYCRSQYDYYYDYEREEYDNALVSTLDGNFSSNSLSTTRYLSGTTTSDGSSSFWHGNHYDTTYNYDRYYNYIYDYGYNNWSLDLTLSSLALDSLSTTGLFNFGISSQNSTDFLLRSAVMTVDINENPASVPEPSTLAIFVLGMIGLASRRFKKKS